MPFAIEPAIRALADLGTFDIIIPFLLVFAAVYGILTSTKALGTERDGTPRNNLNAMAAFVMGFLVVASMQIVEAIASIARYSAIALVGVVLIYTLATMLDLKIRGKDLKTSPWPKIFVALIVGAIAIAALGAYDYIRIAYVAAIAPALLLIAALGLLIYAITHSNDAAPAAPPQQPAEPEPPKLKLGR